MERPDIQELMSVLECAEIYFQERKALHIHEELLYAIITRTINLINQEVEISNIGFDYSELVAMVWPKASEDTDFGRKVRPELKKIDECLTTDNALNQYLHEKGKRRLELNRPEIAGGKGNKVIVWLGLQAADSSDHHVASDKVQYQIVRLHKPYFWIKPFINVRVAGISAWIFLFSLCLCIAFTFSIPYVIFKYSHSVGPLAAFGLAIVFMLSASISWMLYRLLEDGLIKAPALTVRLRDANAFFILARSEQRTESGRLPLEIKLVSFEAKCGVCGDQLMIEKGGRRYRGQYIGKCSLAPLAHRFSFDHVLKYGVKIN